LSDAQNLLDFFKHLVTVDLERVEQLDKVGKLTLEDEIQRLSSILEKMEFGNHNTLCLRGSDDILLGFGEIERRPTVMERHVAELWFGLLPDHIEEGMHLV
jgi:hypothetical protein